MDVFLPWYLIAAIFNCWDNSTGRASMALWTHHWPRSRLCWDLPALCGGTEQGCSQGLVCSLCFLSLATFLSVQPWQDPHVPRQHGLLSVCCGILWETQLRVRAKQSLPSCIYRGANRVAMMPGNQNKSNSQLLPVAESSAVSGTTEMIPCLSRDCFPSCVGATAGKQVNSQK